MSSRQISARLCVGGGAGDHQARPLDLRGGGVGRRAAAVAHGRPLVVAVQAAHDHAQIDPRVALDPGHGDAAVADHHARRIEPKFPCAPQAEQLSSAPEQLTSKSMHLDGTSSFTSSTTQGGCRPNALVNSASTSTLKSVLLAATPWTCGQAQRQPAHMPTCPHAHMPTCPHAHRARRRLSILTVGFHTKRRGAQRASHHGHADVLVHQQVRRGLAFRGRAPPPQSVRATTVTTVRDNAQCPAQNKSS